MRRTASWGVLFLMAGAAAMQPGGCAGPLDPGDDGPGEIVDEDLLSSVLEHARDQVVLVELEAMQLELDALQIAIDSWAASPDDDAARQVARDAFTDALVQWGRLDALQVGPSAPSLGSPAGQDLRDAIYSWPTVNACRVDQETVAGDFTDPSFFEVELVNVYGLDSLEYLLYASDDNACPSQVDINSEGIWVMLGAEAVTAERAAYAVVLVDRVAADVDALHSEWTGSFGSAFVAGSGPYEAPDEALDDLFQAVFYIELMKDEKLAFPLGLRECGSDACPEMAESQSADLSAQLLRANLAALTSVLAPSTGPGFAELLEDAGESDLAEELRMRLTEAEAALAPVSSVRSDVVDDDGTVEAAYDAVAALATLLENDVATVLALSVPSEAAGDND